MKRSLPDRRSGYNQKFKIDGHSVFLRTGEFDDGALGEIFISLRKEGDELRSILNALCVAVSMGLQNGIPLEEFCSKYVLSKFQPNGVVSYHDNIKFCTSILDAVFRDLAINYLGQTELAHVKS